MEQPIPGVSDIKDQIFAEVRRAMKLSNHTDSFWENVQAFVHAVDWKVRGCRRLHVSAGTATLAAERISPDTSFTQEPWIRGILAGHVAAFLLVLLCRRNVSVLTGVFAVLGKP